MISAFHCLALSQVAFWVFCKRTVSLAPSCSGDSGIIYFLFLLDSQSQQGENNEANDFVCIDYWRTGAGGLQQLSSNPYTNPTGTGYAYTNIYIRTN